MKPKVLLVIIDGFSSKYLSNDLCPNLYKIAKENYHSQLQPLFGFQGVGAAIYSGASMNSTGVFTEFTFQKNESHSSPLVDVLSRLTDFIPNDWLCAVGRQQLYRILGKQERGISNVIPSHLVRYFAPKIGKPFYEANSLGNLLTIFDVLRLNGLSFFYKMPSTRSESFLFDYILQNVKNSTLPSLTVIHPCSLDILAHNYGPNSPQVRSALQDLDSKMFLLYCAVQNSRESINVIIMSDHGMIPITNHVDIFGILKSLSVTLGKDYLVFLDSTMARFWFFNKKAEIIIKNKFSRLRCGKILDKSDLKTLGINEIDKEYGEMFFVVNEGWVVYPDFFRKSRPPLGMHGYAFSSFDTPIFIGYSSNSEIGFKKKSAVRFVDVMPSILGLLGLSVPQTCEGTSLNHD